jgi:hypothetical protein
LAELKSIATSKAYCPASDSKTPPEGRDLNVLKSINKFPHPLLCLTGNVIIQLTLFVGLLFSFEKYPTKLAPAGEASVTT